MQMFKMIVIWDESKDINFVDEIGKTIYEILK